MIDYLGMLSKHELDQRMHGLSGVGIVLGDLWAVLKLRMESSASEDTPHQNQRGFYSS